MKENELKSYDIASFNIELEYNKQIAPITKKIDKLNSNHETKSLNAHKDFLTKEKKSKERINQLNDKAVIKNQKVEKAVENKIKKLRAKENRIKKEFDLFVEEKTAEANIELDKIDELTKELKEQEKTDKNEIKTKYKTNIESYVEKLDIYNNNFENNKQFHVKQIKKYQDTLNKNVEDLQLFHEEVTSSINKRVQDFMEYKEDDDKTINRTKIDASRHLSNLATNIRKNSNKKIEEIENYVEALKDQYENEYNPKLELLKQEIINLKESFEQRRDLIEKDLEINIIKLEQQLEEETENKNKKAKKNINMKINLFNVRATTTIKYEERLLTEKLLLLEKEEMLLEEQLRFELLNLDKLEVFLLNDENELKETGDYFKDLNIVLKTELNNFELANNNYLLKHEQLKADFTKNYTKIFSDLKESTVRLAQTYLEKIADNNHAIDEINKFLDTAEPLTEIEVNRLREDIEISEVTERFKIKYAKQAYETKVINNQLAIAVQIEDLKVKERLSEVNKDTIDIKNKEIFDKALEKAKLKHSKAQEVYNLRLNNTKLERNLLKNRFDTEISISEHEKALTEIDVRKHNALISKEIEYGIKNHEMEANYKIEVINKGLEEDLLKLDEQVSKAKYEKDAYSSNLNLDINLKKQEIQVILDEIDYESIEKLSLIDQALERELKEPSRNILKTETIIDERLAKLDVNNAIFIDFINDSTEGYKDNKLTLEQIREVIINNSIVYEKSTKYINRTYQVLVEALKFMNDIEKRALMNRIAATAEQGPIKRMKKQLDKMVAEDNKQEAAIRTSETDHVALITSYIKEQMQIIKKANPEDVNQLVNITDRVYNEIFTHLQDLQANVKKEITVLYHPLTKNDQELIDHANKNAETARQKVLAEKEEKLTPVKEELRLYIEQKETERSSFNEAIDTQLTELRANINHHKNVALEKVKEISTEKDTLVNAKKQQKQVIEESEEKEIVTRYESIDNKNTALEETYNNTLEKLEEKDAEAKKIFDYEDRIYNIAVESATARFNDANVRTNNIHLNNAKNYRNQIEKAKKDKENNLKAYNKELLDLTKRFEKNIFTVRPRLEESIGDAQKAIDKEIAEKERHLKDLVENNNKIILSAENSLYTAFHEGYDKLNNNLQNYVDKYRVIENEYVADNSRSNDVINNNNITFSNALFELSKNKHARTLEQLMEINKEISREEE
jgi:hypothetical protein